MGRLRLRQQSTPVQTANMAIFLGTSNAVGWLMTAADVPENLESLSDVYTWTGSSFDAYVPGVNGGGDVDDGEKWGPEAEFARQWTIAFPGTPLYIYKRGWASSDHQTDWAPGGTPREAAETGVAAAVAHLEGLGNTVLKRVLVWHTGELDADNETKANAFEVNFTEACEEPAFVDEDTIVVVARIHYPLAPFRNTVRAAQAAVAAALPNGVMVDTDDCTLGDNVHYDVAGNIQCGANDFFGAFPP